MRCGASADTTTSHTVQPQPEIRGWVTQSSMTALDLTALTIRGKRIANLFSGTQVALVQSLIGDVSEHQAGQTHCQ